MNLRTSILPLLFAALMAGEVWSEGEAAPAAPKHESPAKPAAASQASSAKQDYDAIFSDILKSLPQEKRALVDSAHGAQGNGNAGNGNGNGNTDKAGNSDAEKDKARKAGEAKRAQALQALPPEVKARVDKAISDLDNRRKEKQAEFKELEK